MSRLIGIPSANHLHLNINRPRNPEIALEKGDQGSNRGQLHRPVPALVSLDHLLAVGHRQGLRPNGL